MSEMDLSLYDAALAGWFQNDTGELFQGLPIHRDDVVLDVGCGDGTIAHFCARQGAAIILADIDPVSLRAAVARVAEAPARGLSAFVTNSDPLPLADEVASVVIFTEVLEHVDDPVPVLAELVRVGRPGARYLLTVPDPVGEKLQKKLAPPSYFTKPNHLRIIERDEFQHLVEAAGLTIERCSSYGFYWSLWWLLFWPCKVDFPNGTHPLLTRWEQTWKTLLETPGGHDVKRVLDKFMPKSQLIIARKP